MRPAGVRVSLSQPSPAEQEQEHLWLPEAAAAVWGRGTPDEPVSTLIALEDRWDARFPPGTSLLGTRADGVAIAVMRVRTVPDAVLVIDALAVRRDQRNLGYGHELVMAAESGPGAGLLSAAAGVPRANGLAVYFWLRAGYRPCFPDPTHTGMRLGEDRLWMVRDLVEGS